MAASLASFANLALAQGQVIRSVHLFGAANAILQALSWRLAPSDNEAFERNLRSARMQLGEEAFDAAWADGCALSLEQAEAYALNATQ